MKRKAVKKAAPRRRRKAHRAPVTHRRATSATRKHTRRRSYSRKSKGALGEMFSASGAQGAFKAIFSGVAGYLIAAEGMKLLNLPKASQRAGILALVSFASATMGKMPMFAAGIAAAGAKELMSGSGGSALSAEFVPGLDDLEQLPEVLNESYLSENSLMENSLMESYLN